MPAPPTNLLHSVADLLNRPGSSRPLVLEFAAPEDLDLPLVEGIGSLRLDGVLESLVDGVLVRGTLRTSVDMACARCLAPVAIEIAAEVAELYSDPDRTDPDEVEAGYEIRDGMIDLDRLVRDALLPRIPLAPRCRPDCKGLCPTCGADLNAGDCGHDQPPPDPRWAGLEGLRLREGPTD